MTLGEDLFTQDLGFDTDPIGDNLIGLHGVDPFGRLQSLDYRRGGPASSGGLGSSLTRFDYTYDLAGNRLTATRTPVPAIGASSTSTQEQDNAYDTFQRLINSAFDHVDGTASQVRSDEWSLDAWGTWTELTTITPTGPPGGLDTRHTTDAQSRIPFIEFDDGTTPVTTNNAYDASGNLIFDGTYCYQYDAWNRLIQINNAHAVTPGGGQPIPGEQAFEADDLVKHYTYDGLGRLARTISPFPAPGEPGDYVRSERFFYDGIRRIQEVYTDPLLDLGEAYAQGESGAQQAFNEDPELDPEGLTGGSESGQTGETGGTGDPGDPGDPQAPPVVYLAREYVWGPGDGPGSGTGIYELLAIFDENREPWWAAQDAGQDLVALIDAGAVTPGGGSPFGGGGLGVGNGFGDGSNSAARLVGEFSYTAYGELLTAASHAPHPDPHLGHKGLFLDRLDTGVVDPLTGAEVARHALGAKHTYYMVNRSYDPQLGRFLQRDPNATGLTLVGRASGSGIPVSSAVNLFDLSSHLSNGPQVFGYLSANPWTRSDPVGLYSDPFEWAVDEYLAEDAAYKAEFMSQIVSGFNTIGHIAWQVAQFHPAVGLVATAYSAVNGTLTASQLISSVSGPVANLIGKSFSSYSKARAIRANATKAYAGTQLHHVVPKFMGGWDAKGRTVTLTTQQHHQYHKILDDILHARGMPRKNAGTKAWERWLAQNPTRHDDVRAALVESVDEFHARGGPNMLGDLWYEMSRQGFLIK